MNLHITQGLNKNDKQHIDNELYRYNLAHFPEDLGGRYEEIGLYLRDENSNIRGAIIGAVCWNWLEIYTFIIDEEIRKCGYGSQLLLEIEKKAQDKQCDFIKVDTLSFQALGFYEKHGYKVFGSIDNVGRHFKHYYLKKDLNV